MELWRRSQKSSSEMEGGESRKSQRTQGEFASKKIPIWVSDLRWLQSTVPHRYRILKGMGSGGENRMYLRSLQDAMTTELKIAAQRHQLVECDALIFRHQNEADHFINLRIQMMKNLRALELIKDKEETSEDARFQAGKTR